MSATDAAGRPGLEAIPPRAWRVLAVTGAAAFMSFLDATIVNIAFPDIESSFRGTPVATLSWVLNAYAIVFAGLLIPAGRIADRIGRRRAFLTGLVLFVGASALCAAAPSAGALVAARALQAVGAAVLTPTSLALVLPEFPLSRRATAVGVWGMAGAVAAATGPSLGGVLVDAAGWRWIFLVNLPVGLAAWAAGRRSLRESRDADARRPDALGSVLVAGAVGLLALGLVEGPDWGWSDPRVLAAFAAAAALLPLSIVRSQRHPAPALDLALFRVRSFAIANAGTLAFGAAFYAMLLCNVLFLTQVWGYSVVKAGLALTPGPLMAAAFAGPAGRLADRFGQRAVAAPGALVYAAGGAMFIAGVGTSPHWVSEWLPATLLTGAGVGLTFPTLGGAAASSLPPARFAVGAAVNATARQLGAVLGVAILIALLGTPSSPSAALAAFQRGWAFVALGGVLAAVAAAGLGRGPVSARLAAAPVPATS
jgi:EmrB/QacA subfamily drug resistance transporter